MNDLLINNLQPSSHSSLAFLHSAQHGHLTQSSASQFYLHRPLLGTPPDSIMEGNPSRGGTQLVERLKAEAKERKLKELTAWAEL